MSIDGRGQNVARNQKQKGLAHVVVGQGELCIHPFPWTSQTYLTESNKTVLYKWMYSHQRNVPTGGDDGQAVETAMLGSDRKTGRRDVHICDNGT